MLFKDYLYTHKVYHIIDLFDLKHALNKGVFYDDKITYSTKYKGFHTLIQNEKPEKIPTWVVRKKAIFASLNYDDDFPFHPNSVVLGLKINPEKCWIANENLANQIYAPFVMKDIAGFKGAINYVEGRGKELLKKYWDTSISFLDNLSCRLDLDENYNAEVLILHNIEPHNIEIEYIVSGHEVYRPEEWKEKYSSKI